MRKSDKINKILQISTKYDESELKDMTAEELEEILEDLQSTADMFPNGRDFEAEDEDFI